MPRLVELMPLVMMALAKPSYLERFAVIVMVGFNLVG